jgi:hypothetical protein
MCSPGNDGCCEAFLSVLPGGVAEDVHQAAAVGADHAFGTGRFQGRDLVLDHGAGNFRLLDREGAAEAAAFRFMVLFGDRHLAQIAEQLAPGQMDAHLAARRAGGVEDDGAVAPRSCGW